jgi:hypothetical protein
MDKRDFKFRDIQRQVEALETKARRFGATLSTVGTMDPKEFANFERDIQSVVEKLRRLIESDQQIRS